MNPSARFRLPASELLPLSVKRDLPGALRAATHLGALALSGWLLSRHLQSAWGVPLMLIHGYLLAFLFSILHETAHQTAFRTRAINSVLGHFAGFALFLPYEYYRAFHWITIATRTTRPAIPNWRERFRLRWRHWPGTSPAFQPGSTASACCSSTG